MRNAQSARLGLQSTFLLLLACSEPAIFAGDAQQATHPGDRKAASTCSPDLFPTNLANPISCCQDKYRTWHTNDGAILVKRVKGVACTEEDGVGTNCGVGSEPFVPCAFGPCGAKNEWSVLAEEVHVFVPESKPDACGWSVINTITCRNGLCDWPAGADRQYPEPFAGQPEYAGLTSTCPYTRCLVGGIPGF